MASVVITWAAGKDAGAGMRRLAKQITKAAATVPDNVATGASTVLTITDTAAAGSSVAGVQITAGPYQSALFLV